MHLIDRDYGLIRRFKTTTSLLHDSQINLSKKMKWFKETECTLDKITSYEATLKTEIKEYFLEMIDILRNKMISSKFYENLSLL